MSNTSQARKDRRQAKRNAAKAQPVNVIRPTVQLDPLELLAKAELAKITEEEELAALNGDGGDLWGQIEQTFQTCRKAIINLLREIADMNQRDILVHMASAVQFTNRVRIFHADVKQAEKELNAIHELHAHRLNDKSGPRESLAGMEIFEHYMAWQAKYTNLLDKTIMELAAMFDEARRKKMAVEAAAAAAQDPAVVTDVAFAEVPRTELAVDLGNTTQADAAAVVESFQSVTTDGEGMVINVIGRTQGKSEPITDSVFDPIAGAAETTTQE